MADSLTDRVAAELHKAKGLQTGGAVLAKAGWDERLHPRGPHGHWTFSGTRVKRAGTQATVHNNGSGEAIGRISKVEQRYNLKGGPMVSRYHIADHRGKRIGQFDRQKDAHMAITEAERLHQGLGPSVEHKRLVEIGNQLQEEKGSRTIARQQYDRAMREHNRGLKDNPPELQAHHRMVADRAYNREQAAHNKIGELQTERGQHEKNFAKTGGTPSGPQPGHIVGVKIGEEVHAGKVTHIRSDAQYVVSTHGGKHIHVVPRENLTSPAFATSAQPRSVRPPARGQADRTVFPGEKEALAAGGPTADMIRQGGANRLEALRQLRNNPRFAGQPGSPYGR